MKRARTTASMAALLLVAATYESGAEPLGTMDEVGAAIQACWSPPAGTSGSAVTLSFSFNRDGKLIGPPMPTAINVPGDETARQAFVDLDGQLQNAPAPRFSGTPTSPPRHAEQGSQALRALSERWGLPSSVNL